MQESRKQLLGFGLRYLATQENWEGGNKRKRERATNQQAALLKTATLQAWLVRLRVTKQNAIKELIQATRFARTVATGWLVPVCVLVSVAAGDFLAPLMSFDPQVDGKTRFCGDFFFFFGRISRMLHTVCRKTPRLPYV